MASAGSGMLFDSTAGVRVATGFGGGTASYTIPTGLVFNGVISFATSGGSSTSQTISSGSATLDFGVSSIPETAQYVLGQGSVVSITTGSGIIGIIQLVGVFYRNP